MSRVMTGRCRISYPELVTPKAFNDGDDPKFSATFVFESAEDIQDIRKAVLAVAKENWGAEKLEGASIKMLDTAGGRVPYLVAGDLRIRLPWYDDPDLIAKQKYPEGSVFIRARSGRKPGLVTEIRDPETGKPSILEDPSKIYAGVYVRASLDVFAYDHSGNRGVAFGLGNIQLIGGGEAFAGVVTAAEDEFKTNDNAAVSLDESQDPLDDLVG